MTVEIGELRNAISADVQEAMIAAVQRCKAERFYMQVWADWHVGTPNLLQTKIMMHSQRPPELVGTFCIYIDKKLGKATPLWNLPQDFPRDESLIGEFLDLESAVSGKATADNIVYH